MSAKTPVPNKDSRHTCVVDLPGASVHGLQEFIHLLVSHLLAQVRQDVFELADSDEASHILVEHLEAAAVFIGLAGIAEATWPVENALEGLEVDCKILWLDSDARYCCRGRMPSLTISANVLLQVVNLRQRGVLAASAEQVSQAVEGDTAVAALVEERKGLLVVGRSLCVERVRCHGSEGEMS